jgi:ligand-binding sensor domain-containing protein/signal transduction histidine kinase
MKVCKLLFPFFIFVSLTLLLSSCGAPTLTPPPTSTVTPTARAEASSSYQQSSRYNPSIRFERIGIEQGLSQNSVNVILQDSQGFLWFGTQDGLNRYDGYTFTIYRPDVDDPSSISDRWVTALVEDGDGNLWVGTRQGGLNRFDPRSGQFTTFRRDPAQASSLSDNRITSLLYDSRGSLWIGSQGGLDRFDPTAQSFIHVTSADGLTSNRITSLYEDSNYVLWVGTPDGLNRYDPENGNIQIFKHDPSSSPTIGNNRVTAIQEDGEGNLWIGTYEGLTRIDRATGEFKHYEHDDATAYSLGDNAVFSLLRDHNGGLWVGTENGLDFYNARNDRFVHYRNQPANTNSLSSDSILNIFEDNSGVLWVGTYSGGLNKYNRQQDRFTYYRYDPEDTNSLSGNVIFPITVDTHGMVWIGTYGAGLNRFNPITSRFIHYRYDARNSSSLSSDEVYSILADTSGYVWVGTSRALDRFDPSAGNFRHFYPSTKNDLGLSGLPIYVLYEDSNGTLWAGTSRGLDQFEPQTGTFIHYAPNPADQDNQVMTILEDANHHLWIGTFGGGLHRFNSRGEGFISYFNDPQNSASLGNNSIFCLFQDREGTLWIGTGGGGLDRYVPETNSFVHYTEKNGLPSNVIYGILEDDSGDLWMSTNNGLVRYDRKTETFRTFTASDGLQSNEFNMGAYALSTRGEMYFGGINGINSFRPLQISDSLYVPSVTLTSITQEGQPIKTDQQIQYTRSITLTWPQNEFEFEFAALAYGQPNHNQYAYMLENFDKTWNYIGTRRNGRYTNLPGGTYTLLLNGSNSDGVWSDSPLRIQVTVIPPFWETTWFRVLAVLIAGMVVAGGYRFRLESVQRRNRELAGLVRSRTHDLEKRTLEIETLYEADERILRTVSLNQVFRTLVDVSTDSLKADRSMVFVWEEEKDRALPRVSRGFSEKTLSVMKFARGEGIVGQVFATGEPVIISEIDLADFRPDVRAAIIEEGIQSFIHLPIKVDTHTVGVFNVGFTSPGVINDDIVRLYTALVQRASLSIANMQLFEQTKDLAVMEERNRLARDLHDSAKQKAFAALAQLGTANGILSQLNPTNIRSHLNEAENLVYEVIQELTFLIQEIYPMALQEKGLPTTLREYIFEWENRNDIPVNMVFRNEQPLELGTEQAIYRIIQETLANIARHSQATRVEISLVYRPDLLEVAVEDNGRGFDVNQKIRGMGLRSIRERAVSIRGSLQIQSEPGQGTRVLIQVPIKISDVAEMENMQP